MNNDWPPAEAEARQSWPPKTEKNPDKLIKIDRQRKKEKKYIVTGIHKNSKRKIQKLLTLELYNQTSDHIELVKYNHSDMHMLSDK